MKFGISFLPDADGQSKSPVNYFKEVLYLSKLADEAGLSYVKMTEHYLHPYGGFCPSPLNFLSAVSQITNQIRLMTGCLLPVFHHPIQLASETSMLDALSVGRVDVGFARAYLPYEFAAFGIDMDESRDRFSATINTVKKLWTENSVTVDTPYFKFNNAKNYPDPVQNPHPPIWIAAVNSRQSFAWIGEKGFNLLVTPPPGPMDKLVEHIGIYRETFLENHSDKTPQIAISLPLCIAKTNEVALKESELYLQKYLDVWASAADAWAGTQSKDYPNYTGMANAIKNNSPKKMRDHGQAIVGTPSEVIQKINALKDLLGVDVVLWQIDYGDQPLEVSERSLNLFINEVLPFVS